MNIDPSLKTRLSAAFNLLNKGAAVRSFPGPTSLSAELEKLLPATHIQNVNVAPKVAALFATAAVEIWLRSVHSFLISTSLTETSPIWASVCGYYSSHYSVRALAHLLGYFQLFRKKRIVRLELHGGKHICAFDAKSAGDREHQLYWKVVKRDAHFATDPLFTENHSEKDASDVGHRDRANYADHLSLLPPFHPLDVPFLKRRIQIISQIEFTAPPIPLRSRFPDVESIQVIAYHRLVKFRQFLDEVLGVSCRFWSFHRNPGWTSELMDFQLTDQYGLSSLKN